MARPTRRVTGFFGLTPGDDYFTIEDPVKGEIESALYGIAGDVGSDLTQYVLEISITRGVSRQFQEVSAGTCVLTLSNRNRVFDSLHVTGPFYGTLVPKKILTVEVADQFVFVGKLEKIRYSYERNRVPVAVMTLSDCLAEIADTKMSTWVATAGDTIAERITDVLNRPDVLFGANRDLDTGVFTLQGDTIADRTNTLGYLKLVNKSDFGRLSASRENVLTFRDRLSGSESVAEVTFINDGTGITYRGLERETGQDSLFNHVEASRLGGASQFFENAESIDTYGFIEFPDLTDLIVETDDMAYQYGAFIAGTYSEPEDRFASFEIEMYALTPEKQAQIARLDLGSTVSGYSPVGGVGAPIQRLAVIEGINHTARRNSHIVSVFLGDPTNRSVFTIEDDVLGEIEGVGRIAF